MIDTYRTSAFPHPLQPRLSQGEPAAKRGHGRAVVAIAAVVALNLLLSVGGFLYLYTSIMTFEPPAALHHEGETSAASAPSAPSAPSSSGRRSWHRESDTPMASMTVKPPPPPRKPTEKSLLGYLQWNIDHSILRNVGHYKASWLRVQQPGFYYVYARVSFSGGNKVGSAAPLVSVVRLWHDHREETAKPLAAMKAYCSREDRRNAGPCTTSQGQLLQLQTGNLLAVWVENSTWVDYEKEATTFGMYKL